MTLTYFFMLVFVWWVAYIVSSYVWPSDDMFGVSFKDGIKRLVFAAMATWFFHNVW